MNGGDHLRLAQHQQVVVTFEVARPVGKTRAAKIRFAQAIALDHGAHAPVQNQNSII